MAIAKKANPGPVAVTDQPVRRPFLWLEPEPQQRALPASAARGLPILDRRLQSSVPAIARALVQFSFRYGQPDPLSSTRPPSISVLNRRRRAARVWLTAILNGKVDRETIQLIATNVLPKLAGSGPEIHRAARRIRRTVEFVRGQLHGALLDEPAENLLPEATGLHTIDTVLAAHLEGYVRAARKSAHRAARQNG